VNHQVLVKIKDVTESAQKQVDSEIVRQDKACQKGCNSCCHQIVDVFTWEEPKIFEYVLNSFDRKKKKALATNLKQWFKVFNKNTRDADRSSPLDFGEIRQVQHLFREEKVACPFLMSSVCSIYNARPMVCRVHYESESAENCRKNPHLATPKNAQEIFHNATGMFKPEIFPVATKPLAYLVAEEFGENIQSKPMAGVIYDPNSIFSRI